MSASSALGRNKFRVIVATALCLIFLLVGYSIYTLTHNYPKDTSLVGNANIEDNSQKDMASTESALTDRQIKNFKLSERTSFYDLLQENDIQYVLFTAD